jgi:hypothetical protein
MYIYILIFRDDIRDRLRFEIDAYFESESVSNIVAINKTILVAWCRTVEAHIWNLTGTVQQRVRGKGFSNILSRRTQNMCVSCTILFLPFSWKITWDPKLLFVTIKHQIEQLFVNYHRKFSVITMLTKHHNAKFVFINVWLGTSWLLCNPRFQYRIHNRLL